MHAWPPCESGERLLRALLAGDSRAERLQARVDSLVAAVDLLDVADDRAALGRERRGDQGHTGADVGRYDGRAVQAAGPDHERAVRIAQQDTRAHRDQAVDEEEPAL